MKKLLCLLLIGGCLIAFSSCVWRVKSCHCKEKTTGYEQDVPIKAGQYVAFSNCKQLQNALNEENDELSWTCK